MSLVVKANQFFHNGQIKQAEQLYRQLLKQNPNDIDALWGLGKVALAFDSYQASYDIFGRCVELVPKIPQLWLSFAQACERLRRFEKAEKALVHAYQLKQDYLPSLQALAVFYCQSNQLDKANKYLDVIVHREPDNIQAFALKVRIKSQEGLSGYAKSMLDKLTQNNLSHNEQVLLHYAFAQLYQQTGDLEQAFFHFKQANDKQRSSTSFSVADMEDYFASLIEIFSKELIKHVANNETIATANLTPIFIVGQPRSGSTLLEQMLSAHSDISTAGELPFLAGDIAQGIHQITGQEFPFGCQKLTAEQCSSLGQHYLNNMQTLAPNAKFIIDKMPANYQSIGLIKQILPQAKIIHIRRDVKDVSWSIFTNHFAANEPYFCSLDEIAQYHTIYQQVMSHWQNVLPDFVHHVNYEDLVKNPSTVLTDILAFCGLDFKSACLDFSDKERYISTLSDVQLRTGLQANRTKAWQVYEKYLPDCFNELT